jgi:pimeloyl-[acyl-carrier protein] methyl ester esterase
MLVFVHGWGLDSTLWSPLRALIGLPGEAIDLGHLGPAALPVLPRAFIGVGHSFGALWLLQTMPERLAGFIALAGFARFTAAEGWPGVPARPLARMRTAFRERPGEVLNDFRGRCGLPPVAAPADTGGLAAGLAGLADWDARARLARLAGRSLVLAAGDDPIVPPALAAATATLAGATLQISPAGGHVLPLTQAAWCAGHIRGFAAAG